jgi:hypothetical protein
LAESESERKEETMTVAFVNAGMLNSNETVKGVNVFSAQDLELPLFTSKRRLAIQVAPILRLN